MKLKINLDQNYINLNQLGTFLAGIVLVVSFSTESKIVQAFVDTNSSENTEQVSGTTSSKDLSAEQLENASIIINVGKGVIS